MKKFYVMGYDYYMRGRNPRAYEIGIFDDVDEAKACMNEAKDKYECELFRIELEER